MITRRNFLGTTAIIGTAGTAILGGQEPKRVANAAEGRAPESTVANPRPSGAPGSTVGTYLATRLEQARGSAIISSCPATSTSFFSTRFSRIRV
jgi:anaerobic selenocysteine-containing dehydrogenase